MPGNIPSLPQQRSLKQPTEQPAPSGEYCAPAKREGMEALQDPEFYDVVEQVAEEKINDELAALYADYTRDGPGAEANVHKTLLEKCAPCAGSLACPIKKVLGEKFALEQTRAKRRMLFDESPLELLLARLNKAKLSYADYIKIAKTPESTASALQEGKLDLMLDGIHNTKIVGGVKLDDLPDLKKIGGIQGDTFDAYNLTIEGSQETFLYVDCPIKFDGPQPNMKNLGRLASKMFGRMKERGKNGHPQIFSPDSTMQKVILTTETGHLAEIRKANKDRWCILVIRAKAPGEPNIIVNLGAHGGNDDTQKDFIRILRSNGL